MSDIFRFTAGDAPILISIPHDGREVPADIAGRFTDAAKPLADTDWHVCRLYDFARRLGASVLEATHSRYVVDLNRDPDGKALYPGASNTEICPLTTFEFAPIYRDGADPTADEVAARIDRYWRPYHAKIAEALDDIRARFGVAVLFDAHSIRSNVPRFFDGRIDDFNFGTGNAGTSADAALTRDCYAVLQAAPGYTSVLNGRFTGGFITRHYGNPAGGVHSLQLELSWATYMDEDPPYAFRPDKADRVRPVLRRLLETAIGWARQAGSGRTGRK